MTKASQEPAEHASVSGGIHAEFRGFVCWNPTRVATVMQTEALQTAPELFLATHSEIPLYRSDLSGAAGEMAAREYTEEKFLQDFLEPEDYAFVAVLGGAGTGKSHLIRWLATRIPSSATRRVLLIPRGGTSLHEVLRRVLEGVEGGRFDEYRERLLKSSVAMSIEQARVRLLDNLAMAVEAGSSDDAGRTEEEEYLAAELPHLLRDVAFREHFLDAGGVLDRLAMIAMGGGGVHRQEARVGFSVADLPLGFGNVNKASQLARDFYRTLVATPELQQAAVTWLNMHLDDAVGQLLQMSGTNLLRLMSDVRAALAVQGVELVVLIEDLATLQGIDQQLLESLIIRPRQAGMQDLCALRAAVAMTSGYYEGLRKNVHQRFDFRVVMGESDTRGNVAAVDVERFTVRYLNAARLAPDELTEWFRRASDPEGDGAEQVASACDRCPFRDPCHQAFGHHDGMGLYPFTPAAVANIRSRVSPAGFNPRTQLKEGYKPILENYPRDLQEGRFPPPELLQRLGGSRLTALVQADLQRLDRTDYQRRTVLLDLWSTTREVVNLDAVIHRAFDLPQLAGRTSLVLGASHGAEGLSGGAVANDGVPSIAGTLASAAASRTSAEAKLNQQLEEIDAWASTSTVMLSQDLTQILREVVYPAVVGHIDWNALHLIPGDFAGSTKVFRQGTSINFRRQFLADGQAAVQLRIPLREDDFTEAALAVQGLLLFKHHRSWQFTDGGKFYRAYLRQVDQWAQHVLDQFDRVTDAGETWDPVPAAVELLAFGARVLGRPKSRDPDRSELVDALVADPPERDESYRSEAWQRLTKLARKHHDKLREVVLSRVACSKGDSRKLQIIDVAHVLPHLAEVRRSWQPTQNVPANLTKTWRFIADYRAGLEELLEKTVTEERTYQLDRYAAIAHQLGVEPDSPEVITAKRRDVVVALRQLLSTAADAGVLAGVQKATFEEKLDAFQNTQIHAWAESIQRIRTDEMVGKLLPELSLIPTNTARVCVDLLELAETMLTRTEAAVRQQMAGYGGDTVGLEEVHTAIGRGLEQLVEGVSALIAREAA